jgi:2-polyprenyl-3-methyl-5-hydroxy-6-metoxy-1,4-benzoquinol methylase
MSVKREANDGADRQRVADRWSAMPYSGDFSAEVYWLAVPEVERHFQRRACAGRTDIRWHDYCLEEFLAGRTPVERMLSIGCGIGKLERALAARGAFQSCEAFDVAPGAIDGARREADEAGFRNIDYQVRDLQAIALPESRYDAVWCSGSLHHIEDLESAARNIAASLKPGGFFFLNEYVGPNRFDFSPRQKEAMHAAFALIPPELRDCFFPGRRGERQEAPHIPRVEDVIAADPSEAIRSSEIVPALRREFEIVAMNEAGGTLLQFLLSGIAGNFRADNPKSMKVLDMLMGIEEALIDSGDLQSDFVILVARPKTHS